MEPEPRFERVPLSPSELFAAKADPTPDAALPAAGVPSAKAQSWGVVISIVVIVMMIIVGAFYAWGKRIAQNDALTNAAASSTQ